MRHAGWDSGRRGRRRRAWGRCWCGGERGALEMVREAVAKVRVGLTFPRLDVRLDSREGHIGPAHVTQAHGSARARRGTHTAGWLAACRLGSGRRGGCRCPRLRPS